MMNMPMRRLLYRCCWIVYARKPVVFIIANMFQACLVNQDRRDQGLEERKV